MQNSACRSIIDALPILGGYFFNLESYIVAAQARASKFLECQKDMWHVEVGISHERYRQFGPFAFPDWRTAVSLRFKDERMGCLRVFPHYLVRR